MSVTVEGSLRIKWLQAANGSFCVGDSLTEIGEFWGKDPVLDQFDEGVYPGHYVILRIFSWSYISNGRLVVELRCRLADLQIHAGTEIHLPESPVEPDPADEAPPHSTTDNDGQAPAGEEGNETASAASLDVGAATQEATSVPLPDESADRSLFGDELYAFVITRKPVKLDPAIDDRRRFREQRNRLKSGLEYAFVPEEQTWYPSESERYRTYLTAKSDA